MVRLPLPVQTPSTTFVVGCGRSGTTLLGALIGAHPDVRYLFEPWPLWYELNPAMDVNGLFGDASTDQRRCVLGASDAREHDRERFYRIFTSPLGHRSHLVEKTPHNVWRIEYLRELVPGAKFVHVVRSGTAVAKSIARLSADSTHVGKRTLNRWWGENDLKWRILARDVTMYLPELNVTDDSYDAVARAALEWVFSLHMAQQCIPDGATDILEIKLDELRQAPVLTLQGLAGFLGLEAREEWLETCVRNIGGDPDRDQDVELPGELVAPFNGFQEHYGFPGRARAKASG